MILNIKSIFGCFFYVEEPLSLSGMQFLKSNQFIWNNQEGNYLLGDRATFYFQNYERLDRCAKRHFDGVLWFENCTVLVESDNRWICIKKDEETDLLEIESADDSISKNKKFELVSSASDLEWLFINDLIMQMFGMSLINQ